jgi:hypothetical protein
MRLKKVDISAFRGIAGKLSLNFPLKNGRPSSMIILGDNGSGKSSIVDGIEFCLQSHISQASLDALNIPSVMSYANFSAPQVRVTLENGEFIERNVIPDEDTLLVNVKEIHPLFAISPLVLRRHDILRFIDAPDAEKTIVFSNYLRESSANGWEEYPKDRVARLKEERVKIKQKRDELRSLLAQELKVPVTEIPYDNREFHEFTTSKMLGGISKENLEERGFRVRVNQKVLSLASETLSAIEDYREIKAKIHEFKLGRGKKSYPTELVPQLLKFLGKVSENLTESFLEISPVNYIDGIAVEYNTSNSLALSIRIIFKNGKDCRPRQMLSEANLDLLALLFFLAFMQESAEQGQAKLLILDDVLQSVDATIRVSFMNYLLKNFADWQLIITAHDRLWHRQLTELMNAHGHPFCNLSINAWTFEKGPEIKESSSNANQMLIDSMNDDNPSRICGDAGLLLEHMCDVLSVNLEASIIRRRNDRYTLGDLWPGTAKLLRKTGIKPLVDKLETQRHYRNVAGAHYNEWAMSISLEEARLFGKNVLLMFERVYCNECHSWLTSPATISFYSCKCGKLTYSNR